MEIIKQLKHGLWSTVLVAALLVGCSKDETEPPLVSSDLQADVVLTPRSFENQIYTSYLYQIPFVTNYQGMSVDNLLTKDLFKISLVSTRSGKTIEVKMHESEINEEVTERYTLPGSKDTLWMQPRMVWKYDALRRFDKTRNMAFRWTVFADGQEVCNLERTFSVRSINQCVNALIIEPFEMEDGFPVNEDSAVEIGEMFAGYVEEENSAIDGILNHALRDVALPSGFNGYQSGDENYLFQQMCAIWYVLQQGKISYSNATDIPGHAPGVRVQNIRFFDQVLKSSQANCVEGTCMLASIYQRFDLHPFMILLPNHMFLGIGNSEGKLTYFLETTMIGNVKLDDYQTEEEKWEASKLNFKQAMATAQREFEEVKPHIEAGDAYYNLIDLNKVREYIPSINYGNLQIDAKGTATWKRR